MLGNTPPALPIYRRVRSPLAQPPATLNENAPAFTTPSPPPLPTKDFTIPSPVGFLANSDKSNDSSIDDSKPGITLPKLTPQFHLTKHQSHLHIMKLVCTDEPYRIE